MILPIHKKITNYQFKYERFARVGSKTTEAKEICGEISECQRLAIIFIVYINNLAVDFGSVNTEYIEPDKKFIGAHRSIK